MFEAETVTVARAKEIINGDLEGGDGKPLFCVHGFNTQPGIHLKNLTNAAKKFNKGKFTLVPVIWPNERGLENYYSERPTASGAGKAF